mgnify:CR=1 FL=1
MKKVKTKVKDLALEISVEIKDILSKCKELSIIARSSSSSISDEDAEKIKNSFSKSQIVKEKSDRDIVKRTGSKVTIRRKKAAKVKEVVEERNSVESDNLKTKHVSKLLKNISGVLIPGGFGKRGTEGKIAAINYARVNKIPFLGICSVSYTHLTLPTKRIV